MFKLRSCIQLKVKTDLTENNKKDSGSLYMSRMHNNRTTRDVKCVAHIHQGSTLEQ